MGASDGQSPRPLQPVPSSASVSSLCSSSWDSDLGFAPSSAPAALQGSEPVHMQYEETGGPVQAEKPERRPRRRRGAQGNASTGAPPSKEFTHSRVPKSSNLVEKFSNESPLEAPTTMMVRNIPNRYSQRELIEELETLGFAGSFDFLYAPT